jgi:hypothetical protein
MWAENVREENFWGNVLTFFFFVLNSFQGGINFSEWPALQWTYPPLICGLPSAHFAPRNFFNSGSISKMFSGSLLRKGVLRGFKHPNMPVVVDLTEL